MEDLTKLCKKLEHYETPEWAVRAILEKELMTPIVIDPCCGTGVLSRIAEEKGYEAFSFDIHDWGYKYGFLRDFLKVEKIIEDVGKGSGDFTVLMNPPFSLAVDFVKKAFELVAKKVVCFQRFSWLETKSRRDFWEKHPPNRIYICGDRASCWRHDIPHDKRKSSSPTAHAWFVWEKGQPKGTVLGHIYKGDK